jgi:seryl-tRNA synthetase
MIIELELPASLSESQRENVQATIVFVDERVHSAEVVAPDVLRVVIDAEVTAAAEAELRERLERFVDARRPMRDRDLTQVRFDQSDGRAVDRGDVFAALVARGDVKLLSPGVVALSGRMLRMFRNLDARLRRFADEQGAEDLLLPITTSLEMLDRSGFFDRTPQFARLMTSVRPGEESLRAFVDEVGLEGHDHGTASTAHLEAPQSMCRSAICLSSYPLFEGQVLTPSSFRTVTVFGKAFRNEASNVRTLERLHEFSMRELVYFGDRDYVTDGITRALQWFEGFMKRFGLEGNIQTANDPFFSERLAALQFYQLSEQSKFEVRWRNPHSGNQVSVGSVNNHGAHFAKAFDIRLEGGEFATTGCVGFGYERLIFLFLSQYGPDESQWSEDARNFWFDDGAP